MITRVEDSEGNVLHDCIALGCAVSWDGEVIDAEKYASDVAAMPEPVAARADTSAKGERVAGAEKPDTSAWDVRGNTARLRPHADA